MHKLFLDTHILLDWIFNRDLFGEPAKKLIQIKEDGQILLYTSAISIADITYIGSKQIQNKRNLRSLISKILEVVKVEPTTHQNMTDALNSDFKDLEDGYQYHTAKEIKGLFAIITRNKKDFSKSKLPVYSAAEYLKLFWGDKV